MTFTFNNKCNIVIAIVHASLLLSQKQNPHINTWILPIKDLAWMYFYDIKEQRITDRLGSKGK